MRSPAVEKLLRGVLRDAAHAKYARLSESPLGMQQTGAYLTGLGGSRQCSICMLSNSSCQSWQNVGVQNFLQLLADAPLYWHHSCFKCRLGNMPSWTGVITDVKGAEVIKWLKYLSSSLEQQTMLCLVGPASHRSWVRSSTLGILQGSVGRNSPHDQGNWSRAAPTALHASPAWPSHHLAVHTASQRTCLRICSVVGGQACRQSRMCHMQSSSVCLQLQALFSMRQQSAPAFPCTMTSCPLQTCQVLAAAGPAIDNALGIKQTTLHIAATSSMSKHSRLTVQDMTSCIAPIHRMDNNGMHHRRTPTCSGRICKW